MPTELSRTIKAFFETSYANAPTIFPRDANHKALHRQWRENSKPLYTIPWYQDDLTLAMVPMAEMVSLRSDVDAVDSVIQGHFRPSPDHHISNDDYAESLKSIAKNLNQHRVIVTKWLLDATAAKDGEAMQELLSAIDRQNVLVLLNGSDLQDTLSARDAEDDHQWWLEQFSLYFKQHPASAQIIPPGASNRSGNTDLAEANMSLGINAFFQQTALVMANRKKQKFNSEYLFFYQYLEEVGALNVASDIKRDLLKGSLVVDNFRRSSPFYRELYSSGHELERNTSSPELRDLLLSGELKEFYEACDIYTYSRSHPSLDISSVTDFDRPNIITAYIPRRLEFMRKIDGDSSEMTHENNQSEHWDLKAIMMSAFVNGTPIMQDVLDNPKSYAALIKPVIVRKDDSTAPWYDALIRDYRVFLRTTRDALRPALQQSMLAFKLYPLDLWNQDPQWHQPVMIKGEQTTYLKELIGHYGTKLEKTHDAMMQSSYQPTKKASKALPGSEHAIQPYYKLPYDDYMPTLAELLRLQATHNPAWLIGNGYEVIKRATVARLKTYMPAKQTANEKQAWLDVLDSMRMFDTTKAKDFWLTLLTQPCVPANHKQLLRWGKSIDLSDHEITYQVIEAREAATSRTNHLLTESGIVFDKLMLEREEKMLKACTKKSKHSARDAHTSEMVYEGL